MADRQRPMPKQRPEEASNGRPNSIIDIPFGGTTQPLHISTATMYDTRAVDDNMSRRTQRESFPDTIGLPNCVKLWNSVVTAEQKHRDSQLPKLLHDLDEACKHGANDVHKGRLASSILHAASSPLRKYRILHFFELLDHNKDGTNVQKLPGALVILEKYATNLLKAEKHPLWKIVKFNLSIIQNQVFPVIGAIKVLEQMGYTQRTDNAFTFPDDTDQPDTQSVVVLASDLVIARYEVDALLNNRHPFLKFISSQDFLSEISAESDQPIATDKVDGRVGDVLLSGSVQGGFCGVCSEQNVAKFCKECDMQFCQECDERWHSHVQRRSHFRFNLSNPALKEKREKEKTNRPRPVPAPRQRKVQKLDSNNAKVIHDSKWSPTTVAPVSPAMTCSEARVITSAAVYQPVLSLHSGVSSISPSNQEMRRPPSRTSPESSPGTGSLINLNQSSQNKLTFRESLSSTGDTTLANTQINAQAKLTSPQGNQMPGRAYPGMDKRHDDVSLPRNTSPVTPTVAGETVSSCPNCHFLVSSAQSFCPCCKFPLSGSSPKFTDSVITSSGLSPTAMYPYERVNPLKVPPTNDNLKETLLNSAPSHKGQSLVSIRQPDLSPRTGGASILPSTNSKIPEPVYEEVIPLQRQLNEFGKEWSCEHCTFLNPMTTQVCLCCCKTPSDLKNHPSVTGQKPQPGSSSSSRQTTSRNEGILRAGVDPNVQEELYATPQNRPGDKLYMTPKDSPLEGGIYMTPKHVPAKPPPLPPRKIPQDLVTNPNDVDSKVQPGGRVVNAQKSREQELSEKEKAKKSYEEKYNLMVSGKITEEEFYNPDLLSRRNIDALLPGDTKSVPNSGLSDEELKQLLQAGVISQEDLVNNEVLQGRKDPLKSSSEQKLVSGRESGLTEEKVRQLLQNGVLLEEDLYNNDFLHTNLHLPKPGEPQVVPRKESSLSTEERMRLFQEGIIPIEDLYDNVRHVRNAREYGVAEVERDPAPKVFAQADIQAMFDEFHMLELNFGTNAGEGSGLNLENSSNYPDFGSEKPAFRDVQNFHVMRDNTAAQNIYDQVPLKKIYDSPAFAQNSLSSFLSLPTRLGNLRTHSFIEDQGRMYIEWMKQAEIHGFTPEELNLATNLSWQDPKGRDPVQWLKEEWSSRLAEVIGKVTEMTSNENDCIGNLSTEEAKQALVENDGSVQSACKSCIESRREKLAKMSETAGYGRVDCLNALDNNDGNIDKALLELEKKALEPIRKRVLGNQDGLDGKEGNSDGVDSGEDRKIEAEVTNKNVSFERRVRIIFAEKNMKSWGRAETAVKLIDKGFSVEDSIEAAGAYGDMERSLGYLRQECPVCMDTKTMSQMITFLSCQCRICKDCVAGHLTFLIKERNIHQLVCPVCDLPDLTDEAEATEYFNNLDIMMRQIVDKDVHDLFQRKLRDRTLRKEPNFRWCAHCSCGFINELPQVNRMTCPNCGKHTCFSCKKPWEAQHEGISCEQFARWKEENDEGFQMAGLAGHLARHGIDCPECKFRYDLAKGGCMHFKCYQCSHEFCSGCYNPFKHGEKCTVSQSCARKGIHAHHPRDCLFYLRDWTPQRLQGLLDSYEVDYDTEPPVLPIEDCGEEREQSEEEIVGAEGGAPVVCKVMEQKETPNGLQDAECGALCEAGHAGLCKVHYTEYLVSLIKINYIDPADVMELDEMVVVLLRAEIEQPRRGRGEDENLYKDRILNILKERLPLARPDVELDEEDPRPQEDEEVEPLLV